MNGTELLHSLELVGDIYIEEAEQMPGKRSFLPRAIAAAACVCLLLGGTMVFAAESLGIRITDMFTNRAEPGSDLIESGYDLTTQVQVIPIYKLNKETMDAARAQILLAYEHYEPHMSWWPGHFQKKFDSAQAAWEYIGCEDLVIPDWDLPQQSNEVNIYAYNPHGDIQQVNLSTRYYADSMNIGCNAQIWTAAFEEEAVLGSRTTEELEYTQQTRTNADGAAYLTITSTALESGFLMMDGYLIREGILYNIHIAYREADAGLAEEYLTQWADMF